MTTGIDAVSERLKGLPYDYLIELFGNQYIVEYGESKAETILTYVAKSDKFQMYVEHMKEHGEPPLYRMIFLTLHSMAYFTTDEPETFCLAALSIATYGINIFGAAVFTPEYKAELVTEIIIKSVSTIEPTAFFDRFFKTALVND